MTIAFVQKGANSQVGGAGDPGNTATITGVTAGNWLVALGWSASSLSANYTPTTPSGWTVAVQAISVLDGIVSINSAIYFKKSTAGGSESCAFNWGPADTYSECCIFEVSVTSGVLTLGPTARNSANGVSSITAGPTTSTGAAALVAAVANMLDGSYNGINISVASSGYTGLYNEPNGDVFIPGDSAYKIAASGTQQATWTWTTNSQGLGSLATFTEGSGSSSTTATPAAGVSTVSGTGASRAATAATAAAGTATVSRTAASTAATTATAAAGIATVSATATAVTETAASAAAGAATVSGAGASSAATTATPAAGSATVSATTGSGTVVSTDAVPAAGSATVSASGSSTAETTATPAAGFATVSGNTSDIDYEAMAAAVWAYTLPNGKTAAETAVETLTLLETMAAAPGCLDVPIEGIFTGADLLRVIAAVQAGKTTITPTAPDEATVAFRAIDDSTTRVTATMEGSERTDVDIDAAD